MSGKRPYRKMQRAQSQDETRRRIVEATMRLHEEVGPRATTISAIAERAGVQRLTVYRHFPDETAVFQACTAHWLELNPPPDPASWSSAGDAKLRLRSALDAFYRYYGNTHRMWRAAHRDVTEVPALRAPMAEFKGFLDSAADNLATDLAQCGRAGIRVRQTIGHALAFSTWLDLEERGLDQTGKVETALSWIDGAATEN